VLKNLLVILEKIRAEVAYQSEMMLQVSYYSLSLRIVEKFIKKSVGLKYKRLVLMFVWSFDHDLIFDTLKSTQSATQHSANSTTICSRNQVKT
jgi:hypothetical protein